ncbi:hypothetical protein [Spirochaeta africana]|uniref:hypothetical protein n=1 Tax=Spirochaeta africana TaxID=46355 RepID=UPI0002F9C053|nr:hypothetical protein [Spirochaeta africana]
MASAALPHGIGSTPLGIASTAITVAPPGISRTAEAIAPRLATALSTLIILSESPPILLDN